MWPQLHPHHGLACILLSVLESVYRQIFPSPLSRDAGDESVHSLRSRARSYLTGHDEPPRTNESDLRIENQEKTGQATPAQDIVRPSSHSRDGRHDVEPFRVTQPQKIAQAN